MSAMDSNHKNKLPRSCGSDASACSPSFSPETDAVIREALASPTITDTILAAKLTLKCQELENQRDKARRGHSSCCAVRDSWKAEALRTRADAVRLLKIYRERVPLGHQPHMMAAEVDKFLSENAGDVPCADARPLSRD